MTKPVCTICLGARRYTVIQPTVGTQQSQPCPACVPREDLTSQVNALRRRLSRLEAAATRARLELMHAGQWAVVGELDAALAEEPADACEHAVLAGDWCEPCNRETKADRAAAEQQETA